MTGMDSGLGGMINSGLGLGMSEAGASILGGGLLGAGLGALTGGGLKGALTGALGGGLGGAMGGEGLSGLFGGGGGEGRAMPTEAQGGYGPDMPGGGGTGGGGGLFGGSGGMSKAMPLMAAGALLAGGLGGKKQDQAGAHIQGQHAQAQANMQKPLSNVQFQRKPTKMPSKRQLENYGYGGEQEFFKDNRLPDVPGMAEGGQMGALGTVAARKPSRYVDGPGTGRSDDIPARVARGEYIFDAEIVSMLGDGSSEAGAQKLDEFRENIRRHKGPHLAKGKMSPDAKDPMAYL
jgi:hypothetical protein